MNVINEFNFFKKWLGEKQTDKTPQTNKTPQLKNCWLKYNPSNVYQTNEDNVITYLFYRTYGVTNDEAIKNGPREMWFHRNENRSYSKNFLYSRNSYLHKGSNTEYKLQNYDTSELEDYYIKNGVTVGVSVKFYNDSASVITGKVIDIVPAVFADFDDSFDDYAPYITLLFKIYGQDGNVYYRIANKVDILDKQFDPELVSYIEEEVEDYLDQIITSEKFEINTTKVEVDKVGFIGLILKIKFKNGIKSNLEDVTTFFKNFNSLKKRLYLINKCDIDIDEITKDTVMLRISKLPPVTENIKKWVDFRDKLICSNCGEEIEERAAKSLNSEDLICIRCKDEEFQTIKSWDFKSMDPSFIPQTTPSQINKYL